MGIDAESTDENGLQQAKLEAAEQLENEVAGCGGMANLTDKKRPELAKDNINEVDVLLLLFEIAQSS